jgi:hypothetical protein
MNMPASGFDATAETKEETTMALLEQENDTTEAAQCLVLLSTCRGGTLAARGSDAM